MPNLYKLIDTSEATELIRSGGSFSFIGDERALAKLPKGNWVGGTTCYFTIDGKSVEERDKVFVIDYPAVAKLEKISLYKGETVSNVTNDAPENGFTILFMPAGSGASLHYSQFAPTYPGLFLKPIAGWITGMYLPDWNPASTHKDKLPKTFNGLTGESDTDSAIAMHFSLPQGKFAIVKTINPFVARKDSPVIRFEGNNSLIVRDAFVDGKKVNLPKYILENKVDFRFPIQANYSGTLINVSLPPEIQGEEMLLHQAVFSDMDYRFTEVAPEFKDSQKSCANNVIDPKKFIAGCSCILNHLSFNTNGGALCGIDGPLTFGEICYQIVGNTSVYLEMEE
ncbi:hypothetical protein AGMMS49938_00420 [Fibrobacterales bacterium]|nr:hypothetical protein AGMMS49938_00420 [Fibrobacterales bacterium]